MWKKPVPTNRVYAITGLNLNITSPLLFAIKGGDEEVFGLQLSDDEPEDEPGPNEDQVFIYANRT